MNDRNNLKPAIRRRFEFIEFQLAWHGAVGRKLLQDQFLISPQQATLDLTTYLDSCPDNMHYDPRQRSYLVGSEFKPCFTRGEASEFFLHLEMLHRGYRSQADIWPTHIPDFDIVSVPSRNIRPEILQRVLNAIQSSSLIKVKYVSLSSESENFRILSPKAIASDGHRWHLRAFDCDKNRFSDFVISRLESIDSADDQSVDVPEDQAWHSEFELVMKPRSGLTARQKAQMEYEYEMSQGHLRISVRSAMLFYYLRFYGFDPHKRPDQKHMENTSSFNLEIVNFNEVEACLERR
jgi:hypothetical protein